MLADSYEQKFSVSKGSSHSLRNYQTDFTRNSNSNVQNINDEDQEVIHIDGIAPLRSNNNLCQLPP